MGGLTEEGAPKVGNLITSEDKSPVISYLFDGIWLQGLPHHRAIDILISQIAPLTARDSGA